MGCGVGGGVSGCGVGGGDGGCGGAPSSSVFPNATRKDVGRNRLDIFVKACFLKIKQNPNFFPTRAK